MNDFHKQINARGECEKEKKIAQKKNGLTAAIVIFVFSTCHSIWNIKEVHTHIRQQN